MAFPFLSEMGFEDGTKGNADAQSPATFLRCGFDHYSTLANRDDIKAAPWRGAYCFRHDLTSVTDHYIQETGDYDTNAAGTIFVRMMVYLGGSPVMANNDMFSFFQLWSGGSTVEASIGVQYTTASGYRFYFNETETAAGASFAVCTLNEWHCIELKCLIDSGVGNDGTWQIRHGCVVGCRDEDHGVVVDGAQYGPACRKPPGVAAQLGAAHLVVSEGNFPVALADLANG